MGKETLSSWLKAKGKQVQARGDKGKGVAVPKKKKDVTLRSGGPLVINEGGSKGKRPPVVQESDDESETEDESSEEELEPMNVMLSPSEREYKEYYDALQKAEIYQTRWADDDLLIKLGIFEDVKRILGNMGMAKVLEMDYTCYPDQTLELIASFELRTWPHARTPSELGRMIFRIDGTKHEISIKDVCTAYGFPQRMGQELDWDEVQNARIWSLFGRGNYSIGRTKSMRIANPAVRYVHKILSNTLYARYEGDKILEDEIALLSNGLQPMFREHFARNGIVGYENVNLGILLGIRIVFLQSWAKKEQHNKSKLLMGGFLTPLLKAAKVRLRNPRKDNKEWLDFAALKRMRFFEGKDGKSVLYRYAGSDLKPRTVLLPNEEITRLDTIENLAFNPEFAGVGQTGEEGVQGTRHSTSDLPLGSPRYYYHPYQGQARSKASEHILDSLDKSQRWHKWSARNFHNIKKTYKKQVKAFKEEIAGLKRMVSYLVKLDYPPVRGDGEPDWDYTKEEARRYSTSNIPYSSWSAAYHPPETSSHAEPSRRKRRLRPIPTPSPPASDNASIHLSSSEDDA